MADRMNEEGFDEETRRRQAESDGLVREAMERELAKAADLDLEAAIRKADPEMADVFRAFYQMGVDAERARAAKC